MLMGMTFRLYISYRDVCWREKIVLSITDVSSLYEEIQQTENYASHWYFHHADLGMFPYVAESPLFPSIEECQQMMNSLHVGQMKYIMRSKRSHCSYFCGLKRLT